MKLLKFLGLSPIWQNSPPRKLHKKKYDPLNKIIVSANPIVSIIIPVYGKIKYTLECLLSIAKHLSQTSFEIIVIDDGSLDETALILGNFKPIHLIRNSENLGFIRSCNLGAQKARGTYLYFLNNDTKVTANWLDALLQTFHDLPGTGLVGSKLIYPDGTLQEAGCIIWQDGSAWNFGRNKDPMLPTYNYAREVDYCSGASIMVPRNLFNELGGFDEHYLPAYAEDSDLALKIRSKGYRVIYQPLSVVIHHEGVTSGTDTNSGVKAYQVDNLQKLYERWKELLQTHQIPGMDIEKAKDRRAIRRILVIDASTPTPDQDAGSVATFNMLLLLREMRFQVTFIPDNNFRYMPNYTPVLQRMGIEMLYKPYITSVKQHIKSQGSRYHLTLLIRPQVANKYIQLIRTFCPTSKILYLAADLHFLRMSREAMLFASHNLEKEATQMKETEISIFRSVDIPIVHSPVEVDVLKQLYPDLKCCVLPLIFEPERTNKSYANRQDIIFVGGYRHTPNVDAAKYFVNEIMPILRKKLPGVRCYLVGSHTPKAVQDLACDDIIIKGFVENLALLFDSIRISIAPLRYGAGIKGKVAAAIGAGLPVVATSIAVEGMALSDSENVMIADEPQLFADAITKLYQDETLWNKISNNGIAFAESNWSKEKGWEALATILTSAGIDVRRDKYSLSIYSLDNKKISCNFQNTLTLDY